MLAERDTAVAAPVGHHVDVATAIADHDHRVETEPAGDVVAGRGHLGLVSDEHPAAGEDPLQFGLEHRRVGVGQPVDTSGLHEVVGAQLAGDQPAGFGDRHRATSSSAEAIGRRPNAS